MLAWLEKVPFFRLLLPLVSGIIFQYFFFLHAWTVPFLFAGAILMLLSYFLPPAKEFRLRWIFGAGIYLFLFAVGILSTTYRQQQSSFNFPEEKQSYSGVITDMPQEKPKTLACQVRLDDSDKKIVCYIQKGVRSGELEAGDRICFSGKIEPFKHVANPDNFDYPRYMYNKGFAGLLFLYSDDWEETGETSLSVSVLALKCRQSLLKFYDKLGLNKDELAVLSALTLGYKDNLSEDVKQSFRATGTAHVLAVSGMHAGILYVSIVFVLGWFFGKKRHARLIQVFIILFIWFYAFLTGFSPSVIRAACMITIICAAHIFGRKGFTYNNIFIAAFGILCYNPLFLFDVGFQLSFAAVLSIRLFQPLLLKLLSFKNHFGRAVWALLTVTLSAQLGTFPLCLFYFGTFPVYFFLTNLLIVPLVSLVFYVSLATLPVVAIASLLPDSIGEILLYLPAVALKLLLKLMTGIIRFFEHLPFAQLENIRLSFLQLMLLTVAIIIFSFFLMKKRTRMLTYSLALILVLFAIPLADNLFLRKNSLTISSRDGSSVIEWNIGRTEYSLDSIASNKIISVGDKRLLSVVSDEWNGKQAEEKYNIDYLHIVNADTISLISLTRLFSIRSVILDRSLSARDRRKIMKECENLNIPCYDINKKGIFRTNF